VIAARPPETNGREQLENQPRRHQQQTALAQHHHARHDVHVAAPVEVLHLEGGANRAAQLRALDRALVDAVPDERLGQVGEARAADGKPAVPLVVLRGQR
jgi:hypothetical protein